MKMKPWKRAIFSLVLSFILSAVLAPLFALVIIGVQNDFTMFWHFVKLFICVVGIIGWPVIAIASYLATEH